MSIIPLISGGSSSLAFSVNLSKYFVSGVGYDSGTIQTATGVTATSLNAPGPVTYEWVLVSGDSEILPTNPFSATTYFSAYFPTLPVNNFYDAIYRCDVTFGLTTVSSELITIVLDRVGLEV